MKSKAALIHGDEQDEEIMRENLQPNLVLFPIEDCGLQLALHHVTEMKFMRDWMNSVLL